MVKKFPMSKIRDRYKTVKLNKKWFVIGLLLWIISFFINVWPILFLSFFCVANAILLSIDRYISAPLDLELSTMSAIIFTAKYGLTWGILAAVMTKMAAIFYNRNIRMDHFFMIIGYVIAAFIANLLHVTSSNILFVGIVVTIIVNIYTVFISKFVTLLSPYEIMMYGITNTIFNIVLFIGFSEIFLQLMMLVNPI